MKHLTVCVLLALVAWAEAAARNPQPVSAVAGMASAEKVIEFPVPLNARDFVTKIYGVLGRDLPKKKMVSTAEKVMRLTPEEDEYGIWLDGENGYTISYYGMTPDVSARASYGPDDTIDDFGYFFLFPYEGGERESANHSQSQFSQTLLQELSDMEVAMSVDSLSDALFEVDGIYEQDDVNVRLVEEHNTDDGSGRFLLILTVTPDGEPALTADTELAER